MKTAKRVLLYGIPKSWLIKIILVLAILLIGKNVFADTSYDMTSRITSPVNYSECGAGSYTGVELNGATNCWNTKTRYQGTLNRIYFNLPAPTGSVFESDTAYRLTIKMATDDWRNNFGTVVVSPGSSYTNNFVDTFTFVSQKQINITFTVPYSGSTTYQYLWVNLPAKSSGYLITGVSNWNLSNVTLTKLTSGSGGGSSTPSGPSTSFDDTAIINSGKENTQDIINNNNTNTQDIIDNNNNNTQQIIDNQQQLLGNCITNVMTGSDIISLDNLYSSGNNFQQITADTNETLSLSLQAYNSGTYLYNLGDTQYINSTKTYTIRFTKTSDFNAIKFKLNGRVRDTGLMINVSSLKDDHIYYISADFFRITQGDIRFNRLIIKENSSSGFASWGETVCVSKLDSTTDAINDVNNSINNDNVDSGTGSDFFNDFQTQDNGGISAIVTKPLMLVNTLLDYDHNQCTDLVLPDIMGAKNVKLPSGCILWGSAPNLVNTLWGLFVCGLASYRIIKDLFHIIENLKNPDDDRVEVMDL